jgi:hypothetical protein
MGLGAAGLNLNRQWGDVAAQKLRAPKAQLKYFQA